MNTTKEPPDPAYLLPGTRNIWGFSFFNAVAFQITLGAPLILYVKSLNASPTVLGIIASLTPLLTIVQLPAAHLLERYGYRKIILMGWSLRNLFTLVIAVVPLAYFLDSAAKVVVILAALFGFNLLRGFAAGAWLPWVSDLIPEGIRGRFLSKDQQFLNLGCLCALLLSAVAVSGDAHPWQFSLILLLSFMAGAVSVQFLRRIPETTTHEAMKSSGQPVPWKAMLTYPPFLRLMIFNLLYVFVVGSLGVFIINFLRDRSTISDSAILALNAVTFFAALLTLPYSGRIIDRAGSKIILFLSVGLIGVALVFWWLQATRILPTNVIAVGLLYGLAGLANASFNLANVRLTMATMPLMGRNHFFALFTVVTSLGLGISPILWGLFLDSLSQFDHVVAGVHWDEFSLYFALLFVLCLVTFFSVSFLSDKRPNEETRRDAEITGNLRRFWRLLQR